MLVFRKLLVRDMPLSPGIIRSSTSRSNWRLASLSPRRGRAFGCGHPKPAIGQELLQKFPEPAVVIHDKNMRAIIHCRELYPGARETSPVFQSRCFSRQHGLSVVCRCASSSVGLEPDLRVRQSRSGPDESLRQPRPPHRDRRVQSVPSGSRSARVRAIFLCPTG